MRPPTQRNLLVELFVEELPPKALKALGDRSPDVAWRRRALLVELFVEELPPKALRLAARSPSAAGSRALAPARRALRDAAPLAVLIDAVAARAVEPSRKADAGERRPRRAPASRRRRC